MPAPVVVQIVIDKPLNQGFDYAWSEEKLGIRPRLGHIVEVPFGSTYVIGVVVNVSAHSDVDKNKIKEVIIKQEVLLLYRQLQVFLVAHSFHFLVVYYAYNDYGLLILE